MAIENKEGWRTKVMLAFLAVAMISGCGAVAYLENAGKPGDPKMVNPTATEIFPTALSREYIQTLYAGNATSTLVPR